MTISTEALTKYVDDVGNDLKDLDDRVNKAIGNLQALLNGGVSKRLDAAENDEQLWRAASTFRQVEEASYTILLANDEELISARASEREAKLETIRTSISRGENAKEIERQVHLLISETVQVHSEIFEQHRELAKAIWGIIEWKRNEFLARTEREVERRQRRFQNIVSASSIAVAIAVGAFSIVNVLKTLGRI